MRVFARLPALVLNPVSSSDCCCVAVFSLYTLELYLMHINSEYDLDYAPAEHCVFERSIWVSGGAEGACGVKSHPSQLSPLLQFL